MRSRDRRAVRPASSTETGKGLGTGGLLEMPRVLSEVQREATGGSGAASAALCLQGGLQLSSECRESS